MKRIEKCSGPFKILKSIKANTVCLVLRLNNLRDYLVSRISTRDNNKIKFSKKIKDFT